MALTYTVPHKLTDGDIMDTNILSALIGAGTTLIVGSGAMVISRIKRDTRTASKLKDHEERLGKLENATSALSDKIDSRFDRVDSKIDNLVGQLIRHLDHGDS